MNKTNKQKKNIFTIIKEQIKKSRLTLLFILITFLTLALSISVSILILSYIYQKEIIEIEFLKQSGGYIIFLFILFSVLIGAIVSFILSRIVIKPFDNISSAMEQLSNGNFKTRVKLGKSKISKGLENSFNTLAKELENTEMLRSDFTNNFSHEFKTPIVSIYGFAKLLSKGGLDKETEQNYIKIIETESQRLASMATNVLNLTKVENQSIITQRERVNISEQIRSCMLVLEKKWTEKNLNLSLDFDEFFYYGDKDLLMQVWMNLLDNAVKYCFHNGEVKVEIEQEKSYLSVAITNDGVPIIEADKEKIFNKFYQLDKSHSQEGNGIGLPIVKRVIELHRGQITVNSNNGKTTFKVFLPL